MPTEKTKLFQTKKPIIQPSRKKIVDTVGGNTGRTRNSTTSINTKNKSSKI